MSTKEVIFQAGLGAIHRKILAHNMVHNFGRICLQQYGQCRLETTRPLDSYPMTLDVKRVSDRKIVARMTFTNGASRREGIVETESGRTWTVVATQKIGKVSRRPYLSLKMPEVLSASPREEPMRQQRLNSSGL